MFKRIAHICLNVENLDRSINFYSKLGFKTVFKFTRGGKFFGAYLKISENNFIEIFENPAAEKTNSSGIAHFCLEADDIDLIISSLEKSGISHTDKKLGCDGTYQIWMKDPDGYDFEVHQYTENSSQFTAKNVEADW